MTIHSLLLRLRQLFSWICYRHQWTVWELLAAAGAILLLLLMWIAKKRRDERRIRALTQSIRQSSSVIGARLAIRNHCPVAVRDFKRPRLPLLTGGQNAEICATEPATASNQATAPLPHETVEHQQNEVYLQQQLDELKAANEELQSQINQGQKNEEHLRRRTARLLATGKKLRQELCRLEGAKKIPLKQPNAAGPQRFSGNLADLAHDNKHPKWSPLELLATHRLSRRGPNPRGRDSELHTANPKRCIDSRRVNEPLDVEKLKAIAALARQIQDQPRRS